MNYIFGYFTIVCVCIGILSSYRLTIKPTFQKKAFELIKKPLRTSIPFHCLSNDCNDSDNSTLRVVYLGEDGVLDFVINLESDEVTPSVHLQLSEGQKEDDKDSNTTTASNQFVINQFVRRSDNEVLLACVGNKTRLEIFGNHIYRSNYSEHDDIEYKEVIIEPEKNISQQIYHDLWRKGRFLTTASSISDTLNGIQNRKKPTLDETLRSNERRIKFMKKLKNIYGIIDKFLNNQTIGGETWRHYCYNASLSVEETKSRLKSFNIWFKEKFPYYYGACDHCNVSTSHDYIGSVHSSDEELQYNATSTEFYECHNCHEVTRFARFNNVSKVLDTRKGRCGEYSVLMKLLLQHLGYQVRWICDREDHVWVEVNLMDKWIHVDPCEAAIDEPLIYQGWGKKQTYILAYTNDCAVEDVTNHYTTDFNSSLERRLNEGVDQSHFIDLLQKSGNILAETE